MMSATFTTTRLRSPSDANSASAGGPRPVRRARFALTVRASTSFLLLVLAPLVLVVALSATPRAATAQGGRVPTVLIHGILSGPQTWDQMVATFYSRAVPAQLLRYQTDAGAAVAHQAQFLHGQISGQLAAPPALVGHSQGGLVARYLSRSQPAQALFTVGTPHYGAEIARTGANFVANAFFTFAIGYESARDGLILMGYVDELPGAL